MTNKKGVSPLIATVLIIGFTILAAVLVINWISDLVTDTTEKTACGYEAGLKCGNFYREMTYSATYNGSTTTLSIANGATEDVTFVYKILDANGESLNTNSTIVTATNSITVPITTVTDPVKVLFMPRATAEVDGEDCEVACDEVEVEVTIIT